MSKSITSYLKKYSYLFGIFLFFIILTKTDFNTILEGIKNVKVSYLIMAGLLNLPVLFIKSCCWNYIKKQQGISYKLKDSFMMYCSGIFIGALTPGRIGDLTKALYLKKDGHPLGKSILTTVLERLSDFFFLGIFIFFGSLLFFNPIYKKIWMPLIIILLLIILFGIFLKTGLLKILLEKIFYILVPLKYQSSWKISFQNFIQDLKIYKLKNYLIIFLITVSAWTFYYLQAYVLAGGAGIHVPVVYLAVIVTIAGLITLIPVSVLGIGTRDAALIFLFAPLSVNKEQAILLSVLILSMSLITCIIGFTCWLFKPIRF